MMIAAATILFRYRSFNIAVATGDHPCRPRGSDGWCTLAAADMVVNWVHPWVGPLGWVQLSEFIYFSLL